ncbi:MAG: FAD binding domain-containing protein [Bryobacteraceae bacterium]|jgi:xanthine dehydrogenase small subunit
MKTDNSSQSPDFLLNSRPVSARGVDLQTTLLDFIREQGLTGAKEGCAEGECGACTVVLVADRAGRSEYRAVNSCLMLASMAAGQEICTVEALAADGRLADVQQAMASGGGSQCGYCTPGFVMSLFAEHYRPGRSGPCDPHELGGNLCRCTGYRPIRDAALSLGPAPAGKFLDRLSRPAPQLKAIEYASGGARFSRPTSLEQCLSLLAADPDARLISGGTDLVVESNLRSRRWNHLVSVEAIAELCEFSESALSITIGAALPLNEVAMRWSTAPEVFLQWMRLFASPPLRNRATLGGNLATASPIGDGAPLLLALDAVVHLASQRGRRTIPLASFFTGYRRTVLASDELIAAVEIPKPLPEFVRFYKVAKRRMDDISTVAAAMAMDWDGAGRIVRARFAFGGVAPVPLRALGAEAAILGQRWNDTAVERVQSALDQTLHPIGDHRGSAEYRLAVAKSLVAKFLWERREAAA